MRSLLLTLLLVSPCSLPAAEDEELFTGAPKDEFEKRADPFSEKRWGIIVAASDAEPLKIDAKVRLRADFDREFATWLKTKLGNQALAETKGDPAETRLREMVEAVLLRYSVGGNTAAFAAEAEAVSNGELRRPFLDFCAATVLYHARRGDSGTKLHRALAEAAELPEIFRVEAQLRVLAFEMVNHRERGPEAEERYKAMFTSFARTPMAEADAPYLLRLLKSPPFTNVRQTREAWHVEEITKAKWPAWVGLSLLGDLEITLGWQARGGGYYRDLSKEQVKGFQDHFTNAHAALAKAWEQKPDLPWAATAMISVVMGGIREKGDSPRLWLDRALAAQADYEAAWDSIFMALRPRWGGTYEALLALGRSCALTGRFDTEIPTKFNRAVFEMAVDAGNWCSLYRHPEVARLVVETREKRLEATKGTPLEWQHRSLLFLERWLIGDTKGAAALLPQLVTAEGGLRVDREMKDWADKLNLDYVQIWADANCADSAIAAEWEKARALSAEGKHAEASQALKAVQAKAPNDLIKSSLAAQISLDDFQVKFADGDWHHLPVEHRLDFNIMNGQHAWRPDQQRLKLSCTDIFGREAFRGELGTRFELRGKWKFSRGAQRGGVCFYFGHPPEAQSLQSARWWTLRAEVYHDDDSAASFTPFWNQPTDLKIFPAKEDSEFLLRRDGEKVSLTVDGKEVISGQLPAGVSGGAGTFGLGSVSGKTKGSAELWDVKVRKLPAE